MDFYISKNILGTSKSLSVSDNGTYSWVNKPTSSFGVGDVNSDVPVEDVFKIMGKPREEFCIATEAQKKAFKALGVNDNDVCWSQALPPSIFHERVQSIADDVSDILSVYGRTGYDKTFKECRKFLRSLSRASVDNRKIENYIRKCKSGPSVVSSLKSFWGDQSEGKAQSVIYSQTGTSTGRLTVKKGPSILTLPAANRDIIVPSQKGVILQADFVSLEPRVMRYVTGQTAPLDIYEDIRQSLFHGQIDRKVVKLATLSALYGSSYKGIAKITGNAEASKNVIRRVRQYFNVDYLEKSLMNLLVEEKMLSNYYGRPLKINEIKGNILVSHFIQSTAVDTALLGFSKLMSKMTSPDVVPIYVIHDAVIFDVPSNEVQNFLNVCDKGIELPIGKFNFDVTKISER